MNEAEIEGWFAADPKGRVQVISQAADAAFVDWMSRIARKSELHDIAYWCRTRRIMPTTAAQAAAVASAPELSVLCEIWPCQIDRRVGTASSVRKRRRSPLSSEPRSVAW